MQRGTASRCGLRRDLISGASTSSARKAAKRHAGNCTVTSPARLRELEGEPKNTPSLRINATGDGKGIIFIGHDGEVYPSGFLPLSLGNVKERNLKSIYTTHPLLVGMRNPANLKGRCGACEYKVICGGSRSRAYAEFEDPCQEDPACPYVPASVEAEPSRLPASTSEDPG